MPDEKTMLMADCWLYGQVVVFINTFSAMNKLLTSNMYCWSHKTLVSIHRIDLSMNGISKKLLLAKKRIIECCSVRHQNETACIQN